MRLICHVLISLKFYDILSYFQREPIAYALCENYIYLHREPTHRAKISNLTVAFILWLYYIIDDIVVL